MCVSYICTHNVCVCCVCVCVQVQDELNRLPLGSVPVFLTVACFLVQEGGDLRVRNNLGQAPASSCPADKRDIVLNYLNKSKSVVVLSLSACCLCVCVCVCVLVAEFSWACIMAAKYIRVLVYVCFLSVHYWLCM